MEEYSYGCNMKPMQFSDFTPEYFKSLRQFADIAYGVGLRVGMILPSRLRPYQEILEARADAQNFELRIQK